MSMVWEDLKFREIFFGHGMEEGLVKGKTGYR